jgi:hypothetical protein
MDGKQDESIGALVGTSFHRVPDLPKAHRLRNQTKATNPDAGHEKRSFPAGFQSLSLLAGDIEHPWEFLD